MQKVDGGYIIRCRKCGNIIFTITNATKFCENCKPSKHYRYSTKQWRVIRAYILKRDGFRCTYCGLFGNCVDHVIPISRGGSDSILNLTTSCRPCNSKKSNNLLPKSNVSIFNVEPRSHAE